MAPPKTIGTMNGTWAKLFKLSLVLFPVLCGVVSGSVKYVYDHELRIRYIENTRLPADEVQQVRSGLTSAKHDVSLIEARLDRLETKLDRILELQMKGK